MKYYDDFEIAMFHVGDIFFSEKAMIHCFSKPLAKPGPDGRLIASCDHKQLVPNPFEGNLNRVSPADGMCPVLDGNTQIGLVDCTNTCEDRANSYWKVVDVAVVGCGNSRHASGQEMRFAKYECLAIRVDADGRAHDSGETVRFSNVGALCISDLVQYQKAA